MPRGNKNAFIKEGNYTCKCGREFNKSQSYYAHLSHCKVYLGEDKLKKRKGYHTVYGKYVCKCGKVFDNSSSYIGHTSHCLVHLGEERYLENLEKNRQAMKIACEYAKTSHTDEVNKRQSETRIEYYNPIYSFDKVDYFGQGISSTWINIEDLNEVQNSVTWVY